jgi:hypothetical protein
MIRVIGYVVEKKISTKTKWERVVTLDPSSLAFTVENLKEKQQYYFRVLAENPMGLGEPAETPLVSLRATASTFPTRC